MVALPIVLGAAAGGRRPTSALVAAAALLAFVAHDALVPAIRRRREGRAAPVDWSARRHIWGSSYLAAAVLSFTAAVVSTPPSTRGPLLAAAVASTAAAAVYAAAGSFGAGRRVGFELVGMAGCSLIAPMMGLASGRGPGSGLVAAPALAFGYSASTLAFVRAWDRLRDGRAVAISGCAAAHALLVACMAGLALRGWIPAVAIVPFAPVLLRAVWGLARPPRTIRQVGLREAWVAGVFAILGCLALLPG